MSGATTTSFFFSERYSSGLAKHHRAQAAGIVAVKMAERIVR
jgi:hypothetical protein